MKTLKDYLCEASLLDIEGTLDSGKEAVKKSIEKWINDNFNATYLKISKNPNSDGLYEVDARNVKINNKNITSLTNGMFVWNIIKKDFYCYGCNSLISLEGAPKEVGGDFYCTYCPSLTTLEGAPKKVGGNFYCYNCDNLISLEGAPEIVNNDFNCTSCKSLISLEGAPKEVGGYFSCSHCQSLTSLEGAPEKIGKYFSYSNCKSLKSKDVPATTKVKYVMHD